MSFFYSEAKKEQSKSPRKARLQDIPVSSLQKLGCSVCPRDKDAPKLRSPKMKPSGPMGAPVYLLGSAPSEEEDEDNNHWTGKAGNEVYRMFGRSFMERSVRSNFVTQCRGDQTHVEIECCRSRVVADIEACKPEVIVCVGDAPLTWATGITSGALTNRGQMFVTRIGKHVCWAYSVLYPNYVHRKNNWGKSEYELALEHDITWIKGRTGEMFPPTVYDAPYDGGIVTISGDDPGDFHRLEDALHELLREPRSAIDFETTGLRPWMLKDPRLLTAAVGTFRSTVAFAVDHPDCWGTQSRREAVKGLLGEYIMQSGEKAAHNLAMELEWAAYVYGDLVLRRTEWADTMMMAHTLDERAGTKSLGYQTRKNFGFDVKKQSTVDPSQFQWWTRHNVRDVLLYNGMDTKWTDLLRDTLEPQLDEPKLKREYERKLRLAPTLVMTESVGLIADMEYAENLRDRFAGSMRDLEKKLKRATEVQQYEQRFGTFSPTNPDHVLKLYRDVAPRPEVRVEEKDGKIRWTTEEEALAQIDLPSARMILDHRAAAKLMGTYIKPVLNRDIVAPDGRMRTKYSSMIAVTGRLASEDPNLQNFPNRKNREVRGIVVPPPGCWLAAFDYGQIEFRVIGMASGDRNLVKYCWTGYDVHGDWATRLVRRYGKTKDFIVEEFGVDWDEKGLKTLRQEMKNRWVFPQFFGSSTKSCARELHIPEDVAADLGSEFWDEFPGVKEWQEELMARYAKDLYVETLSGRKRRGPMTKNELINLPVQGTALDIVTEAMNVVSERADRDGDPELCPVINIHDDLTFHLSDETLSEKIPLIAREMCMPRFDYINVPLIVEVKVGKRWHELEEVQVFRSNELFGTENPYA